MGVQIYKWGWISIIKCSNRQTIQPNRIEQIIKIISVYEIKLIDKVWKLLVFLFEKGVLKEK